LETAWKVQFETDRSQDWQWWISSP
jgi:hypothetical protein